MESGDVLRKHALAFGFACVVLAAQAWWSKDGEQPYGKISDDLKTAHMEICPNPAFKVPKVLVTSFGWGQREVVELKQRFAYEPILFPQLSVTRFSPFDGAGSSSLYCRSMDDVGYAEATAPKFAAMETCDAFLFGRLNPNLKSVDKFLEKPFERVKKGAGMVWIAPYYEKVDIPGVALAEVDAETIFPCSLVPRLKGTKVYEGAFGKGRVIEVVYTKPVFEWGFQHPDRAKDRTLETLTPAESDDPLYYDLCLAFVGKCLWRSLGYSPSTAGARRVERVYNANGEETAAESRSAVLKTVRWLNSNGETVDYTIEKKPNGPSALVFDFPKDGFKPDEAVVGALSVPAGGELTVTLTDEYGREIYRESKAVSAGPNKIAWRIAHQKSRFAQVRARLAVGGRLYDEGFAKVYFNTVAQDRDDFCFSIWSGHAQNARVQKVALRSMRAEGIDNVMDTNMCYNKPKNKRDIPRWIHEAGCNYSLYGTFLRGPDEKARFSRDCRCFWGWDQTTAELPVDELPKDHPFVKQGIYRRGETLDQAEGSKDVGIYFFNMGDENELAMTVEKENCFCDACQARFRQYLKKEFGSLEAMNKEYRTKYRSWDEVRALSFLEAAKKRRMPLWADFRAFMEDQWVVKHLAVQKTFQSVNPEAFCGVEGMAYPANSFTGWCLYKFFPHFRFSAPYFNSRDVHAHQYLPRDSVGAAWYGVYESECSSAFTRRPPWQYLFAGLDGAFWWYAGDVNSGCSFSGCTIFRPDLTTLSNFHDSAEEIRYIKESGIGKLMNKSTVWNTDVEIHYSNPCLHASTINPGMTSWEFAHAEFQAVLSECAVGFRYRSPGELEAGIPESVKAFILPYSQALSEKECAALRAFVKRGGVLIADQMPGEMTEHCQFRERSPIADLFNAEKLSPRRTGNGWAVLTDDTYRGIDTRISNNSAGGLANGFRHLLRLGGVRPFATVTDEFGSPRTTEIREKNGITFVCMLGAMASKGSVESAAGAESGGRKIVAIGGSPVRVVTTCEPMHCYDLGRQAAGRTLGYGRTFRIELEPVIGRVLAFSKTPPAAPTLSFGRGAGPSVKAGETLDFTLGNVNGCAIVEAVDSDGRVAFTDRLTVGRGRFVPAFNDKPGAWTMRVRSALGGMTVEKAFTVR